VQVFRGNATHTPGGLTKSGIIRVPTGKVNGKDRYSYKSKKQSIRASSSPNKFFTMWRQAAAEAAAEHPARDGELVMMNKGTTGKKRYASACLKYAALTLAANDPRKCKTAKQRADEKTKKKIRKDAAAKKKLHKKNAAAFKKMQKKTVAAEKKTAAKEKKAAAKEKKAAAAAKKKAMAAKKKSMKKKPVKRKSMKKKSVKKRKSVKRKSVKKKSVKGRSRYATR
jgi:hypothetical protein